MDKPPLISIGMPVRNGMPFVEHSLRSLLDQEFTDFELIISDNASTDETQACCQRLAASDARIRYIRQSSNIGMGNNWSFVQQQGRGEFFLWAAHDDEWSPNLLRSLLEALQAEPEAVLAFPTNLFVNDRGETVIDCSRLPDLAGPLPLMQRLEHVLWFEEGAQKGNLVHGLMRMSALRKIGYPTIDTTGYGEWGGDQLIVFWMAFCGYFVHVPEACFRKRFEPTRRYDPDDLVEHFHVMRGYFARHREIVRKSELGELEQSVLLASLAARETTWMCRVLSVKSTDELRGRLQALCEQCDEQHLSAEPSTTSTRTSTKRQELTSIVILNYNGASHIASCLQSIKRHTTSPYEVIVFDNASTDGSRQLLRPMDGITLVESPVNLGCPPGRAQALALAQGDYVILLDNDTLVTPGWLSIFLEHFEANPSVGLLGPRSNFVSGAQQVRPVSYSNSYELEQFAKLWTWTASQKQRLIPVYRLVGFCMAVRREVLDNIGGFDPIFGKFGFEDDDFTLRARLAGFATMIANDVFVHHTGGPQKTGDPEYNRQLLAAWGAFKRKWQLPPEAQMGQPMDLHFSSRKFDPQSDYVAIPDAESVQGLVYRADRAGPNRQQANGPHFREMSPPGVAPSHSTQN